MSWSLVGSILQANDSSNSTLAITKTLTAGSALVVFTSSDIGGSSANPTISDTVNTYTFLKSALDTGNQGMYAHYAPNVAAGSTTITCNWGGTRAAIGMTLWEFGGLSTTPLNGGSAANASASNVQATPTTGTDAVTSGNITVVSSGVLVAMSAKVAGGQGAPSAGTGFTDRATWMPLGQGGADFFRGETKSVTASTSAGTFTALANATHITIGVVLVEPIVPGMPLVYPQRANLNTILTQ